MAGVEKVEVVVAHGERVTLRVGGVFVKIDADQERADLEVAAMALAPIPTPEILWRNPPALALERAAATMVARATRCSTLRFSRSGTQSTSAMSSADTAPMSIST